MSTESPANVFARVWDDWSPNAHPAQIDAMTDGLRSTADFIARHIRRQGSVPAGLDEPSTQEQRFRLLLALDDVLGDCHPRRGPAPGSLARVAACYARTGSFSSSSVPGAVVPRWAWPNRPGVVATRLDDAFREVVRVPEAAWRATDLRRPPALDDIPRSRASGELRVAFVPMMADLDDVVLETGVGLPGHPDAAWYRIAPDVDRISARIPTLIDRLDTCGADLAVLPEGCLDVDLLERWQDVLRRSPQPVGSRLRWILLGSGPLPADDDRADGRPANAAVVLARATGEVIARHDKFAPFTFGAGQADAWGLASQLDVGAPVHEAIWPGHRVGALESQAGRVVLLVCEDVTRHGEPPADAAVTLAPSLVLVPVFAKELRDYFWEQQNARRWSILVGSSVAVCNSLVVPSVQPGAAASPWRFGLFVASDEDPTLWPEDDETVHFARAATATHVVVVPK